MTGSIRSHLHRRCGRGDWPSALAACSQTTYGTGTAAGMQTLEDLAGIAEWARPTRSRSSIPPGPKIVAPPPGAPLPPPGSDKRLSRPTGRRIPTLEAKRVKAQAAALEKYCAERLNKDKPECRDPGLRLARVGAGRRLEGAEPDAAQPDHRRRRARAQLARAGRSRRRSCSPTPAARSPSTRTATRPPLPHRSAERLSPARSQRAGRGRLKKKKEKKTWKWPWQ